MEIKTNDYSIRYDNITATVSCAGSLRLSGMEEYAPILTLLNDAAEQQTDALNLDLRLLEFLNSSGINVLSKFVINVRQKKSPQINVTGSTQIPWQGKSLKNLQRLLPTLELKFE
ncbi:hypothetical protein [Candidatus Albibeggiatoa sp. nov. BB20]|uniref:slr1659 superfamily regulator n=1 Tax=Candidatus Albibeggiatoa sp. nov. BB20 TaxID=3162723 RepID=UPI0033653D65